MSANQATRWVARWVLVNRISAHSVLQRRGVHSVFSAVNDFSDNLLAILYCEIKSMCSHLWGLTANICCSYFSAELYPLKIANGQNWKTLWTISLLMKDDHLLFPCLAGLPYQILSSPPVSDWVSQFSATSAWRTLKDQDSSCGAAHPSHLLAVIKLAFQAA